MKTIQNLQHPHELLVVAPQILRFRPMNKIVITLVRCETSMKINLDPNLIYITSSAIGQSQDSEADQRTRQLRCPRCNRSKPHMIEIFYVIDFMAKDLKVILHKLRQQINRMPISIVSIDWYCEDLAETVNSTINISQIKQTLELFTKHKWDRERETDHAASEIKPAQQQTKQKDTGVKQESTSYQPIIVSHITDYQHWIETRYVLENLQPKQENQPPCTLMHNLRNDHEKAQLATKIWGYELLERESIVRRWLTQGRPSLAKRNQMTQPRLTHPQTTAKILAATANLPCNIKLGREQWDKYLQTKQMIRLARDESNLALLANLISAAEHLEIRDAILIYGVNLKIARFTQIDIANAERYLQEASDIPPDNERIQKVITKLNSVVRYTPQNHAALYAAIGYLHWWNDYPAAAFENARCALAANPHYSLGKLVQQAVERGVLPPWKTK
ncbi:hypothetical protein J2S36_000413 [Arcanobacterium hippocoleae]|uniref:DUF4192 family protein n=2 Tax=Arcanobacterium hippocoleae TaxID=149017 RepID=A0ABU1T0P2_9ACTO|nr:hypothetical protein [Arcanobacterium hippocoleae]MDR6938870.1 hypothetical protein [Arcanobacterium hippocoleae]